MGTPRRPLPRTGGAAAFVLIAWLLLSLLSGVGVWWAVSVVEGAGQALTDPAATGPADAPAGAPAAEPTGDSAADQEEPAAGSQPKRTRTVTRTADGGTSADPADESPGSGRYTLIFESYEKADYTFDEAMAKAAQEAPLGDFAIIDSDDYPTLEPGYWAVIPEGVTWSTRKEAADSCAGYGRQTGGACYPRPLR